MMRIRVGLAVAALVLATAASAAAQTFSVAGRATAEGGAAIANADVTLRLLPPPGMPARMPNMPGMESTPDRTTKTGADGTFRLDGVPGGVYVLMVDAPGFERSSQEVTVNAAQNLTLTLARLELPGAEPVSAVAAPGAVVDQQVLVDRIKTLEQRILDLESSTVLSDPVTRVKRIEVWVDKNGNEYDRAVPGATLKTTYQRERVYRRENINEKLEEAIADAENRNVKIGVSAATVTQLSNRTRGDGVPGHAYELASADLFFTAGIAQNTIFFADIVGVSGTPPDPEIGSASLLNGFTARLSLANELNLREAWVRTEVFKQRLAIIAGRLDLTNFFDHNAAANDETTQFVSDALVNNPALGLAVNGAGAAAIFDPKKGFNFKVGVQQSDPHATNLSQSIFSLVEGGYVAAPRRSAKGTTARGIAGTTANWPARRRRPGDSASIRKLSRPSRSLAAMGRLRRSKGTASSTALAARFRQGGSSILLIRGASDTAGLTTRAA